MTKTSESETAAKGGLLWLGVESIGSETSQREGGRGMEGWIKGEVNGEGLLTCHVLCSTDIISFKPPPKPVEFIIQRRAF